MNAIVTLLGLHEFMGGDDYLLSGGPHISLPLVKDLRYEYNSIVKIIKAKIKIAHRLLVQCPSSQSFVFPSSAPAQLCGLHSRRLQRSYNIPKLFKYSENLDNGEDQDDGREREGEVIVTHGHLSGYRSHRNSHSLDEVQQRKLPLRIHVLRGCIADSAVGELVDPEDDSAAGPARRVDVAVYVYFGAFLFELRTN
ncbi:hypothetical protein EVAR_57967_1 [Eumeta japonica]|uniref:Uncharacterized protein n=1 Tax=Eumeta variegata TaxID=151549 RepID=A0A4C1XXY2_EUMVA|nr:hypothetical protein EVAR_57967_1 [Eumeta japonica]